MLNLRPEAAILSTLESLGKLKKNCCCLNSIPRASDLNGLGCSLGIGLLFLKLPKWVSVSKWTIFGYIEQKIQNSNCLKTPGFILSQKSSPRMGNSKVVWGFHEIIVVLPILSVWVPPSTSLYDTRYYRSSTCQYMFQTRRRMKGKRPHLPAGVSSL